MGESYRGLTIKIGGDTTGLSRALKSANASIRQTQSELRKINKGLKFDPSSAKLLTMKVSELGQKSQQANAKLATLRKTLKSLRGTEVEKIAKQSKNLALEAENARQKYARIDAELAELYQAFQQVAKANKVAFDKKKPDELTAALRKLGLIDDKLYAKVQALKKAHNEAFASNMVRKQALQYKDLQVEIKAVEAEIRSLNAQQAKMKSEAWTKQRTEIKKLKSELRGLEAQGEAANREFRTLEKAAKLNPANVQTVSAAYKGLGERIKVAQLKQNALNAAIEKLKKSGIEESNASMQQLVAKTQKAERSYQELATKIGNVAGKLQLARQEAAAFEVESGKGSTAYKEQAEQVRALEQRLESLTQKQQAASKALSSARGQQEMRELANQARAAANEVQRLAQKQAELTAKSGVSESALKSLGMTAYATVSPAFMALGYKSVEAADRIDSSFRDMKKTVNGTEEDFDNLREAALEFSRTHAVSSDTILEIEAMGGQLGIAVDKLQDFGTVVSNLDIATNMNADEIAEDLGQLNNILPDLNDNYTAFGDSLVRLGNNMPAQESAIMDVTSRIGSLGGIVGMTTPQVLAWATAIAATGQNSEAAGTAISNTMSDIEGAVAAGGDKLESFAKVAGMSAEQFAKSWNETPSDAMKSFVEGLKNIDEQGGSVDATLQDLGITGVRQKQALEGLAQTTDVLNDALTMSEDAWNGVSDSWGDAGDAAREASQKSEGFSGTLQILKNSADEFGYELGNALVPFLQLATTALQGITDVFKDLPGPVKDAIVVLGLFGTASGTLLTLHSSLSPLLKNTTANLAKNMAAAKANGTAYRMMGVNMNAATAKIEAVAGKTKAADIATKGLVGSLKLLKVAGGAIAFVGLDLLVEQVGNAYTHFKNLDAATNGLKGSIASFSTETASNSLQSLSESTQQSTQSFEDFLQSQAELSSSIREQAAEVSATKGRLSEYDAAIQQLNGTTNSGADGVGKLKSAVDGVNQACGTNYEVVQNAAGAYVVMKDGVEQTTQSIHDLIEAQKLQVQAEAMRKAYGDLYEKQAEALRQVNDQQEKVNKAQEAYDEAVRQHLPNADAYWNNLEAEKNTLKTVKSTYDSTSSTLADVENQMDLLNAATVSGSASFKDLVSALNSMGSVQPLVDAGVDVSDFASKLDEAGISAEQLNSFGSANLAALARNCDGDTSKMIASIQAFNDTDLLGKDGSINVNDIELRDAQGRLVVWNGTAFVDKATKAEVNDGELIDAQNRVYTWNGSKLEQKKTTATATGNVTDGSAQTQNEKFNKSVQNLPLSHNTDIEATPHTSGIDTFLSALRGIPNSITTFLGISRNAEGGIRLNAAGGIVPRYHAKGAIATRAVPLDIVGEAGAEAIVPLTNERYSKPFAKLIAKQVNEMSPVSDQIKELAVSIGNLDTAALASRAAASSAAAQSAAGNLTNVVNNTTNVYQQGGQTAPNQTFNVYANDPELVAAKVAARQRRAYAYT